MVIDVIKDHDAEEMRQLVDNHRLNRIAVDVFAGRKVWIKRFETDEQPVFKWLHSALSPLLPASFLRSSPRVDPKGMLERELRKWRAFKDAGFLVLDILFAEDTVIVSGDAPKLALNAIIAAEADNDRVKVTQIMRDLASSLGQVHKAGLCHGRPHPRDLFLVGREVGYFDFEEEPEAAMPLATAQARDAWLLFLQLSPYAKDDDMSMQALDDYLAEAPVETIEEFWRLVRFFARFRPVFEMIGENRLGSDGRLFLKATRLLKNRLSSSAD